MPAGQILRHLFSAQVPVLLIWFLAIDERTEVPEYIAENPGLTFVVLSLASLYAFLVNLLGNTRTKITSALTMTIAGAGRQIGIIFVTGVFIEHTFSVRRGPTSPPPSAKAAAPHRASSLARPGKHRHQPSLLERSRFSTGSVSLSSCLRLSRMRTCRSTRR